jgi:hypothetical protein
MEKAKKDRNNANIYSVINKYYRKKSQREAAYAVWKAGMLGKWLTIVFSMVGIFRGVLGLLYGDQEGFGYIVVIPILSIVILYLPSMGMRRLGNNAKVSAWMSAVLGVLIVPSLVGVWYLTRCVKALRRINDYKPMELNSLSYEQMISVKKIDANEKKTVTALAGLLALSLLFMLGNVSYSYIQSRESKYSASTLNTVYGDDQFSVKLSENARKDKDIQGENGVTISGSIYSDILANNKAMVKVGCIAYTQNGSELSIAKRETIDNVFNGEIKELRDQSYTVTETSRKYDDATGGLISGFLETSLEKSGSQNTLRYYIGTRRNQTCIVYVIAPGNLVDQIYGDVMGTFTIK